MSAIQDASTLKICTGEGALQAEGKGKDGFRFEPKNKFVFAANSLPLLKGETTDAVYRRMLALTMHQLPAAVDITLSEAVLSEKDYFIYLCVSALEKLYETNRIAESENSIQAKRNLQDESDSVSLFLHTCVDTSKASENARASRNDLCDAYEKLCQAYKKTPLGRNGFYRSLREKGYAEIRDSSGRYFGGLSLDRKLLREALDAEGWNGFFPYDRNQ